MEKQILELREAGKTYNEITEILKCSKSLVSYYCGVDQKLKKLNRDRKNRKEICILKRVEHFQYGRNLKDKMEDFQRRKKGRKLGKRMLVFSWKDVIKKFGWETTCYLTGKKINLKEPKTYQFDHIVPRSKGGTNDLANLGILSVEVNRAKSDLAVTEFIEMCKDVLTHNGYVITTE